MFVWRNALILGLIFIVVGIIYWYVQAKPHEHRPGRRDVPRRPGHGHGLHVRGPAARVARALALARERTSPTDPWAT